MLEAMGVDKAILDEATVITESRVHVRIHVQEPDSIDNKTWTPNEKGVTNASSKVRNVDW